MPSKLRLRIFAGPNGAGKTTIIREVQRTRVNGRPVDLGLYINADDLARDLPSGVDLKDFGVPISQDDFLSFSTRCGLLSTAWDIAAVKRSLQLTGGVLKSRAKAPTDRLAQLLAQYLYNRLLDARVKFTFETVFSHPGKLALIRRAKEQGYKVYLYFIATEDPAINIQRVRDIRVREGGHDVPRQKIIDRYYRTLDQLDEALDLCDSAYLWDNSQYGSSRLFAEMTKGALGVDWKIDLPNVPVWFMKNVLAKHPTDKRMNAYMKEAAAAFAKRSGSD